MYSQPTTHTSTICTLNFSNKMNDLLICLAFAIVLYTFPGLIWAVVDIVRLLIVKAAVYIIIATLMCVAYRQATTLSLEAKGIARNTILSSIEYIRQTI